MQKENRLFRLIGLFLITVLILEGLWNKSASPKTPAPTEATVPTTIPEPLIPETSVPETTVPSTTVPDTAVPETSLPPETEAPTELPSAPRGELAFNTYDITFRIPGDSWEVYSGTLPKEYVTFSSANPAVATFENGVVTATGSGTTTIFAAYADTTISCIIRNVFDTGNETGTDSRTPVLSPPEVFSGPAEFFNDAVFVGDSVSLKLSYYAATNGSLGSAQFLVRGSYSLFHAVNGTMRMTYRGQEMHLEDAIAATGASKVFLMLGMNDIGAYGINKTMDNWEILLGRIRAALPDVEIYIQSMTPVWTGGEKGGLNNHNADLYNQRLKTFAETNGCRYVDVASYMKDGTGGLATEYCSDSYVHLTDRGAAAWVAVLKDYAGYK